MSPAPTSIILAPYYVLWGFTTFAFALVIFGAIWLVAGNLAQRALSWLWWSDGVAMWLSFAAAYHVFFFVIGPYGEVLEDRTAIWLLCGFVPLYLVLRLAPSPLRNGTVLLALTLACWAWSIGAGYKFLEEMSEDAALLREAPGRLFSETAAETAAQNAPGPRPLRKALFLSELKEPDRARVAQLLATLGAGGSLDLARMSGALLIFVPELVEHFRRDLSRLRTYQILQIVLLAAVLLAWGFGREPR